MHVARNIIIHLRLSRLSRLSRNDNLIFVPAWYDYLTGGKNRDRFSYPPEGRMTAGDVKKIVVSRKIRHETNKKAMDFPPLKR